MLKDSDSKEGKVSSYISKEGKRKNYQVHRLVAQEFIPRTKQEKNVINHKDYNTLNNNVSSKTFIYYKQNLQWRNPTAL